MFKRLVTMMLMLLLLLFAVTASASPVELMQIGSHSDESTLNPYTYVTGSPGLEMVYLIYDALFHLDENNIPQPWLVEEYEVSDDGLEYSFKLHEGIKWHDGEDFTAADVAFTYQYVIDHPKSRFTRPASNIADITVEDDYNLTFTLSTADPNYLIQPLADLPILPKHLWEQEENPDEADIRIGTGPYVFSELKAGEYYKFTANADYFKGTPVAETLVFPIIKDTTALFTALKAGQLDAVTKSVPPELVPEFENAPNLKLAQGPGFSTTLVQLNSERFPLNNKAVREAIFLAIDRQDIIDTVLVGQAVPGSPGFIHPDSPFYNPEVEQENDMEKARQVLDNAGFVDTDGDSYREGPDGEEIELTLLVYANNPTRVRAAELIATEYLKELGLNIKVTAMDIQTVDSLVWPDFDVTKGRDYDMSLWGWSASMQLFPDRIVELFHSDFDYGTVNLGAFKSEEFDAKAEELMATRDEARRKELLNELQVIVASEYPIVPLYYENVVNVYNENTFDDWTFIKGSGIINKLSLVSDDSATPPAEDPGDSEDPAVEEPAGNNNTWLFVIAGAAVVLILVFVVLKRKQ